MLDGEPAAAEIIDATEIQHLVALLRADGYTVIAPTLHDGVISSAEIESADDLPAGWTARQTPGSYRLERRDDAALFGYVVGPHSPRRQLHPSRLKLWGARRDAAGEIILDDMEASPPRYAFVGLRGCELDAIGVQDRVFQSHDHADPDYASRRAAAFIVAVDCAEPASTCFCTSMGGDPGVDSQTTGSDQAGQSGQTAGIDARRHDLVLTELLDADSHRFIVRAGSAAGSRLLARLEHRKAEPAELEQRESILATARQAIGRTLDTRGLKESLQANAEHPRWDEIAERCLGCANCTLVCPTCFCSSVEEVGDLAGERAERWRRDDSCFTLDFSYIHGGSVRVSTRSRYRQWLTHKLAHWIDQFGTSGCVGCGRCITWCPVGIDITEEARVLASPPPATRPQG